MPKIGMRMVKTSLAVFICLIAYTFRQSGMPFYSAIAAILCMQPDVESSFRVGLNRVIGTFVGGCLGMGVLAVETWLYNFHNLPYIFFAAIISIMLIPVIYITLVLKKSTASFIACVVFLCITIMHGYDVNPFYFGINRMIDTLIGIFISLIINSIHLPCKVNRNLLLLADLDGTLIGSKGIIDPYSRATLNKLLKKKMNFVPFTRRSIPTAAPLLKDLSLNLPIIAMGGSVLYEMETHSYKKVLSISKDVSDEILDLAKGNGLHPFSFSVQNDILHVYHDSFSSPGEAAYYNHTKGISLLSFSQRSIPENEEPIRIRFIDKEEKLEGFKSILLSQPFSDEISWELYQSEYHNDYYHLDLYSAKRRSCVLLEELKRISGCEKTAAFFGQNRENFDSDSAFFGFLEESADALFKETQKGKDTIKSVKKIKRVATSNYYFDKYSNKEVCI